jgi:hypothetical protein
MDLTEINSYRNLTMKSLQRNLEDKYGDGRTILNVLKKMDFVNMELN